MKHSLLFTCLLTLCAYCTTAQINNVQEQPKSVIFIDFDGQTLRGSSWNWSGPLYLQAAELREVDKQSILAQVAEDFRPFRVLITADSSKYFSAQRNKRIRVIVTPDYQWYEPAAGAAMMGSFGWGDETPAFVFCSVLGNQPSWIAESIAHQVGHTMGLAHQVVKDEQGNLLVGQDGGEGKGCTGWAPIMGVSFYKNRTTWHTGWAGPKGEIWQDEMARIAAAVGGYTEDEQPQTFVVQSAATSPVEIKGIIQTASDRDLYTLSLPSPGKLKVQAVPVGVDSNDQGANLHVQVQFINQDGISIHQLFTTDRLQTAGDLLLPAGIYFVEVMGETLQAKQRSGNVGAYTIRLQYEHERPVQAAPALTAR